MSWNVEDRNTRIVFQLFILTGSKKLSNKFLSEVEAKISQRLDLEKATAPQRPAVGNTKNLLTSRNVNNEQPNVSWSANGGSVLNASSCSGLTSVNQTNPARNIPPKEIFATSKNVIFPNVFLNRRDCQIEIQIAAIVMKMLCAKTIAKRVPGEELSFAQISWSLYGAWSHPWTTAPTK